MQTNNTVRLNKYLAAAGLGSRRACEQFILDGEVAVNGHIIKNLSTQVEADDRVTVNSKPIAVQQSVTLALNKPVGVICSTVDPEARNTVFDLIPKHLPRLFYVGRLDVDSEGLLVMTNRGELSQKLTHPSSKLPKTYIVRLDKTFENAHITTLLKGFLIESGFAKCEAVYPMNPREVKVVLTQGLKRQIRLMFYQLGYNVERLKRIQIGKLTLDGLHTGEWRFLSEDEINNLLLARPDAFPARRRLERPIKSESPRENSPKKPRTNREGKARGERSKFPKRVFRRRPER